MRKQRWLAALLGGVLTVGTVTAVRADDPGPTPLTHGETCPASGWDFPPYCHGPQRLWFGAEYLLWWVKGASIPPLITTGPLTPFNPASPPGSLSNPDTKPLLGPGTLGFNPAPGGRFTVGGWFDSEQTIGLEASYFFLTEETVRRRLSQPGTPGSPALALPFFNPLTGLEDSAAVALPGAFSGLANLRLATRFQGTEANFVFNAVSEPNFRLDLLAGYRYLNLHEGLDFITISTNVPPLPRDVFVTADQFRCENDFHGGQVGARTYLRLGHWYVEGTGKVAFGNTHEMTSINGQLLTNDFTGFGRVQSFPGGYLALPTNRGTFSTDQFAVVPEANVKVGWQPRDWARLFVGYTFLYVSSVARPGDQIDRVINPSQAPAITGSPASTLVGPARPQFLGRDTDFWAQGINFGLELRY
jgi:hypothetical protein